MPGTLIRGRLVGGIGLGRHFTRLDWARRQFIDKLGIDPFPGTLNVRVDGAADLEAWMRLKRRPGVLIENPGDGQHDCDARCYPVMLDGGVKAAIVLPEVAGYAPGLIEVIAEVGIRDALGMNDGDAVSLDLAET